VSPGESTDEETASALNQNNCARRLGVTRSGTPCRAPADLRKYAAELAALAPDVILVSGSASVEPMLQATRTVPIVFTIVPDPVGAGFVDWLYDVRI
jgi:hypothetical protein